MKYSKIIFSTIIFSIFLTSCDAFLISVPPSSYTLEMVALEIKEKFEISEIQETTSLMELEIGKGVLLELKDSPQKIYIFKLEDRIVAKDRWNTLVQTFGKWTKKNYLNLNLVNQGYLKTSIENDSMVCWWKDQWITIVYGENANTVSKELQKMFKSLKDVYSA